MYIQMVCFAYGTYTFEQLIQSYFIRKYLFGFFSAIYVCENNPKVEISSCIYIECKQPLRILSSHYHNSHRGKDTDLHIDYYTTYYKHTEI